MGLLEEFISNTVGSLKQIYKLDKNASVVNESINLVQSSKDAIGNIEGMSASGSEIDGKINCDAQTLIVFGDSILEGSMGSDNLESPWHGHVVWGNALSGSPFDLIYNAGVGGEKPLEIFARIQTDVIDKNPTHCIFLMGMNDGTSEDAYTRIKDTIIATYEALNNAGIYSFICTLTSKTGNVGKAQQALIINNWIFNYFKNKPNCEIVDLYSAWINPLDTDGYPNDLAMRDDTHQGNVGGWLGGLLLEKHFTKFKTKTSLSTSIYDDYGLNNTSKQIVRNPFLTGNTGLVGADTTGEVASYWSLTSYSGATTIASKVTRDDGYGEYQKMAITGADDSYSYVRFQSNTCPYQPLLGESITFELEMKIISATNFKNFRIKVEDSSGKMMDFFGTGSSTTTKAWTVTEEKTIILRSGVYTFTADASNLKVTIEAYFEQLGTLDVEVGRVNVRLVEV